MSTDDFATYVSDQARVKFARAQYEVLTVDECVALVNQLDGVIEQQELELAQLESSQCSCWDD